MHETFLQISSPPPKESSICICKSVVSLLTLVSERKLSSHILLYLITAQIVNVCHFLSPGKINQNLWRVVPFCYYV